MVKDHELIMNGLSPLFEEKVIIWGAGYFGHQWYEELIEMGLSKNQIMFCDSDKKKQGKKIDGCDIIAPTQLVQKKEKFIIVISVHDIEIKKEIVNQIQTLGLYDIDIYTDFGLIYGIYYNQADERISDTIKDKQLKKYCQARRVSENSKINMLSYFSFVSLYNEMILVYQPAKVGSRTLFYSIENLGKYVLHTHRLAEVEAKKGSIEKMAQMYHAKILSVVRDPLSRQLSAFWYHVNSIEWLSPKPKFADIKSFYNYKNFEMTEWDWFNREMKEVMGIDVFAHPFDKEAGYTVIKKGNISLLVLTLEKMNDLENVICNFIEDDSLQLINSNISDEKDHAFAYKAYKEKVSFSDKILERTYNNPYVRHFYTDEQIEKFYTYWKEKSDKNKEYKDFRFE